MENSSCVEQIKKVELLKIGYQNGKLICQVSFINQDQKICGLVTDQFAEQVYSAFCYSHVNSKANTKAVNLFNNLTLDANKGKIA